MFGSMKRICLLSLALALCGANICLSQDAVEARLSELGGRIGALEESQGVLKKQLAEINQQLERLRESMNKPQVNYATVEDLKALAASVRDVDSKRVEDFKKVHLQLLEISKAVTAVASKPPKVVNPEPTSVDSPKKGFEYKVAQGDTLSLIAQAYREKNIKVSVEQILKANPGLKPEKMRVGDVIFIPEPAR